MCDLRSKTRNWVVALKSLIVIHRTLREGDATFRDELLHYCHNSNILQISYFKDDSSSVAWDCSAWVRTYSLFLEERLECFRILRYDIEAEDLRRSSDDSSKNYSRTRTLGCQRLLEQLPALQQLFFRLLGCKPEGAAFGNYLIQYALALAKNLSEFYEFCKALELSRNFQFPILREPPPSFIATMEEYIREAPKLEYHERTSLAYKQDETSSPESLERPVVEATEPSPVEFVEKTEPVVEIPAERTMMGDLLGSDEIIPVAPELDEINALALAIPPGRWLQPAPAR
ncbi:hypothetical protein OPV22_011394 [Ensete ventricosum]|uniref:ENTH domain-containing protein n=1 Tax=Ensete ventricosum TaxID=4639 RepID=A0AAV8RHT2_ENSVE|nr:hypothetical protein OPV22_011394 [Ensete ventricosum]